MPQGTHKGDLPEAVQLKMIAAYMGRITSVDTQIGRALAALEQAGLTESTIISYTADHGDMLGERNRYGKTVMYDSSARIPLIIRYPQALPQGIRRREVVEHVDLYPTFCDLTGLPTPDTVQGHSLLPVMQGHAGDWPDTAFSELADKVLVRQGQHKLTFYDGKPLELYDIEQDPREWDNLVGKPGSDEVVAHLTQLRDEWMARTPPDVRNQVQPLRAGRRRRRIEEIEEPDAQ
jgi:choline-sulfatase